MLQRQWQYELRRKFNLDFKVIDSDSTFKLRRDLGIDTNPWKAFPRIITSMDYLRMPDVLQQFLQASGAGPDAETNGGRTSPHDERLIVFTEYKETLFYLEQGFLYEGFDKNMLRLLYGGMSADEFETVKGEFEDASAAVRLRLATDAASEGINMQEECRWVIHYDVPWSPSRLVQRNGRVSRYGQDQDVSIYYFRCDQEEDMNFLSYVAGKVCQVHNDLGSVERVFDAAIQRHFQGKPTDTKQLSLLVAQEIARSPERIELRHASSKDILDLTKRAKELLESTDSRLGISPQALVDILRAAIAVEGQGALEEITDRPGS